MKKEVIILLAVENRTILHIFYSLFHFPRLFRITSWLLADFVKPFCKSSLGFSINSQYSPYVHSRLSRYLWSRYIFFLKLHKLLP